MPASCSNKTRNQSAPGCTDLSANKTRNKRRSGLADPIPARRRRDLPAAASSSWAAPALCEGGGEEGRGERDMVDGLER
uniref:Uncharacterized protein n=1 Tax=Arundo donax TaxID=35708 RepID=A0A0A8Z4I8_ARUDO